MRDYREKKISYKESKTCITVFKDEMYLCTIIYNGKLKTFQVGFFNEHIGFKGETLIEFGIFLNHLNELKDKQDANTTIHA